MTPTLSIITINYNNKDGLKKTIESVVSQNETNFEYIIIDGASTDGSAELIKEYAEHPEYGKKINYWVSEPDSGIYNAMNKGIGKANGEYLHMLNSGDWYEKDALSHILPKLREEKPNLLLCALNSIRENKKVFTEIRYKEQLYFGAMCHQGMMYEKSLHENFGNYDESYKVVADYDFFLKSILKSNVKTSCIYIPLINFSFGGISNTTNYDEELNTVRSKYELEEKNTQHFSTFNLFKFFIKLFIPYGLILIIRKIKKR